MPHSKSAKKRLRQSEDARVRNKSARSAMRTAVKKVEQAAGVGNVEDAKKLLPEAIKRIDKAAKHNAIHKKNAARKKSQIATRVNEAGKG